MAEKIIQYSFKRYEKKYFLTPAQYEVFTEKIRPYMCRDEYGLTEICNIYYDTDDWRLIRASIEKPVYKEKLRVRSYGTPGDNDRVFVELKKKYADVVYKRRVSVSAGQAPGFLRSEETPDGLGQIGKEIEWFMNFWGVNAKVFIGYTRIAWKGTEDPELRITFDTGLRWRETDLDLRAGDKGYPLLDTDRILMEIKIPGTCPLWLSRLLSDMEIFGTSFSKYGTYYQKYVLNKNGIYTGKEALFSA